MPLVTLLLSLAPFVALSARPLPPPAPRCAPDNGGLTLAEGLCATLVAGDLPGVRHVVVAPNGDLLVARAGREGGVLLLRDTDGDGVADLRERFGPGPGTGIALSATHLYFATDDAVWRWPWAPGQTRPAGDPERLVHELPVGGHAAKSIAVDGERLYVNVGSKSNSCQARDRAAQSPGVDPCTELESRAGVWLFSATARDQRLADGQRLATGLRNTTALTVHPASRALFGATHGRDQLGDNWGFSDEQNAENPAEEFVRIERGDDFGWPYCYFDPQARRKVLAPEYGGDGRTAGRCSRAKAPLVGFPAHWAPMSIAFGQGGALGPAYRDGAFLAFHGSWNRAPLPQQGYRVVWQPMRGDRPAGPWATVAQLAGNETGLRATGLAVGPDGALYLTADRNGRIWRIVRRPV